MMTLDQALDAVNELPSEQREILTEILRKRQIEERRNEIAANARESIKAFQTGGLRSQSADEVIADLRASLTKPSDE